jgi:hypothetical protein
MADELKPCPFCGKNPKLFYFGREDWIECDSCCIEMPAHWWDRRVVPEVTFTWKAAPTPEGCVVVQEPGQTVYNVRGNQWYAVTLPPLPHCEAEPQPQKDAG